ncbi:MAG: hypothetical protein N2235_24465 [Fischerella sp.]|nr:hypothetical protein [Fischerella sp.]
MNNEPPRRQEHQQLSFSMKRENKIMPLFLQCLAFLLSKGYHHLLAVSFPDFDVMM